MISFASGISKDRGDVSSAITLPRPSGQVEQQITRLKLAGRPMHGRAEPDPREVRPVPAA